MKESNRQERYFFCGIGGSGMSALAAIAAFGGAKISGSDRARDCGDSPEKFMAMEKLGIRMFPQDGSGVTPGVSALVVSSAVEDSIPDVKAAKEAGIKIIKRADLLSGFFNESKTGIAIAGTSGKSTVTGMVAVMLAELDMDPSVMNGGVIRNFMNPGHKGLPNMRVGKSGLFVAETDESDGSIALYNPAVAVLNNISLDHKSLAELDILFGDFIGRAGKVAVLNFDDEKVSALRNKISAPVIGFGIKNTKADLRAENITPRPEGVSFILAGLPVNLKTPGRHNVLNALAALGVAQALGFDLKKAIAALGTFEGIRRRMEIIETKNGVTVIDDFGHNPDKIAATLKTLKEFPGRVILIFQPHGFGPLRLMWKEIAATFAETMDKDDFLLMPDPYYAGGTVDRSIGSKDVIDLVSKSHRAKWFEKRADILPFLKSEAKRGDRIVVMGARDDTLGDFAQDILKGL